MSSSDTIRLHASCGRKSGGNSPKMTCFCVFHRICVIRVGKRQKSADRSSKTVDVEKSKMSHPQSPGFIHRQNQGFYTLQWRVLPPIRTSFHSFHTTYYYFHLDKDRTETFCRRLRRSCHSSSPTITTTRKPIEEQFLVIRLR